MKRLTQELREIEKRAEQDTQKQKTNKTFYSLLMQMKFTPNKDKLTKIIICIMIALLIALLSGLNTVANMPKTVSVEKYQPTKHTLNLKGTWQPGELNKEGNAQQMPVLTSAESHQRFIELCEKYDLPADVIWHTENFYGLKEGTILCIAIAETSGGKSGYGRPGCWNYGNVGNNDGGDRHCFPNQGAGLAAIGKTLNNSLLGMNQTIACLNGAGNCIEEFATGYRYSTGKSGNWERNMIGCFYSIYQEKINPQTFNLHNR